MVVSYGCILPKQILEIPALGCINLHPSLLPKYRGAAPINWALISGEEKTGISIISINETVDSGEIILQETVEISPDDDVVSLSEKLSLKGAGLLLETVKLIEEEKAKFLPQDEAKATYAPKLKKEDGLIDWNRPAVTLHNQTRGSVPWPGMYTYTEGKTLKIWKTRVCPEPEESSVQAKTGRIIGIDKEKGILVKTSEGILCLKELQLEGKKRMDFAQFLLGHPLNPGQMLGEK